MSEEMLSPRATHFFIVVIPEHVRQGRLMIPKEFVVKYGEYLTDFAVLKLRNGQEWKIRLARCDAGQVWLQDGWKEFAEHHSLAYGQLLVFRYELGSNCVFQVLIFSTNALEADCCPRPRIGSDSIVGELGIDINGNTGNDEGCGCSRESEEISVGVRNEFPPGFGFGLKRKVRSMSSAAHVRVPERKKMRIDRDHQGVESMKEKNLMTKPPEKSKPRVETTRDQLKKVRGIMPACTSSESDDEPIESNEVKLKGRSTDSEGDGGTRRTTSNSRLRTTAVQRATAFESKRPFFRADITPSIVRGKSYMTIPSWFLKEHLFKVVNKNEGGLVVLRTVNVALQKEWNVKYIVKDSNNKCASRRFGSMKLSKGRKEFIKDNQIQAGDACVFELLTKTETKSIVFRVHIYRSMSLEKTPGCTTSSISIPCRAGTTGDNDQVPTDRDRCCQVEIDQTENAAATGTGGAQELQPSARTARFEARETRQNNIYQDKNPSALAVVRSSHWDPAFLAASEFESANPFTVVSIKASYVKGKLPIPIEFLERCSIQSATSVVLRVGSAAWLSKILVYRYRTKSHCYLSAGWSNFALDNHLEPGDACLFELVRKEDHILKVTIFRASIYL